VAAFEQLAAVADYVAINVSSPNTAQLRELQRPERLVPILDALLASREQCQRRWRRRPALLVKVSADEAPEQLTALLRVVRVSALDGVIATNTTLARPMLEAATLPQGGVSGAPLRSLALATVRPCERSSALLCRSSVSVASLRERMRIAC
jgi:dihydroorotate dehydrogenase